MYEDRYGTPAFSSGDMDQVIALSNEIIAGPYSLEDTDFFITCSVAESMLNSESSGRDSTGWPVII